MNDELDIILKDIEDGDLIEYLNNRCSAYDILSNFDDSDLIDTLDCSYHIFENENEIVDYVIEHGLIDNSTPENKYLPNFRMSQCSDLLERIIQKEGWDYLFKL